MNYKELKDILNTLSDAQLEKDAIVYDTEDQEFKDVDYNHGGNVEIEKASDQLNDENETYFVVWSLLCGLYKVWR